MQIGASSTGGGSWMLELACREVSNITINEVMQLTYLPDTTCHQLATDLGYLCDVLDDLSFAEVSIPQIIRLLRLDINLKKSVL